MSEITIRCTNCGLGFESDYDLEQNLVDQDTGEIHDGCPTCETDAYLMDLIKYPDQEPAKDLIESLAARKIGGTSIESNSEEASVDVGLPIGVVKSLGEVS